MPGARFPKLPKRVQIWTLGGVADVQVQSGLQPGASARRLRGVGQHAARLLEALIALRSLCDEQITIEAEEVLAPLTGLNELPGPRVCFIASDPIPSSDERNNALSEPSAVRVGIVGGIEQWNDGW